MSVFAQVGRLMLTTSCGPRAAVKEALDREEGINQLHALGISKENAAVALDKMVDGLSTLGYRSDYRHASDILVSTVSSYGLES